MHAAIVTMNSSRNYGAALQAYALQQVILKLGYDSAFIDQRSDVGIGTRPIGLRRLLTHACEFWHRGDLEQGRELFDTFVDRFQSLTPENYSEYEKLMNSPPDAEVYVVGSDQVWNTINYRPINFLEFVQEGKRRISYAASLGIDRITKENQARVVSALERFDAISVRESAAADVLRPLLSQPVEVHVDPVLLLSGDEWRGIASHGAVLDTPYILCYVLYRPVWLNRRLRELHRATGMDIVLVDTSACRNVYRTRTIRSAGPREFLSLVDHARAVITTSFHGTAFSIVFEKEFFCIPNPSSPSRIRSILRMFDLEHREITETSQIDLDDRIEYSGVLTAVARERERSIGYLRENL